MSSPQAVEMSQAFFEDPKSYAQLTETADHQAIIGCIDPRDPIGVGHGEYPVTTQTSGGAVGEALDSSLALTATSGQLVTIATGMIVDREFRPGTFQGAHYRCKMAGALAVVTDEMAVPSDFTVESTERWARSLGLAEEVEAGLGRVTEAAKRKADYLHTEGPMDHLVELAADTVHVHGDNNSRVYVINLHPERGLDRNAKPVAAARDIQGYHDNLAASVRHLRDEPYISDELRWLRLASMMRRAAAARSVITADLLSEMTFFEARPAPETTQELRVVEETV